MNTPKLFRWQEGRGKTGYRIFPFVITKKPFPFDCYLIHYRKGTRIEPHRDENELGKHYRLNIILKNSGIGGEFQMNGPPIFSWPGRAYLFRPDLVTHWVSEVREGSRWVLSIGWI